MSLQDFSIALRTKASRCMEVPTIMADQASESKSNVDPIM